jgi:hypothetical protein
VGWPASWIGFGPGPGVEPRAARPGGPYPCGPRHDKGALSSPLLGGLAGALVRAWPQHSSTSADQAATSNCAVSNTLLMGGRFMTMGAGVFLDTLTGLAGVSFWATSALSQLPADSLPEMAME